MNVKLISKSVFLFLFVFLVCGLVSTSVFGVSKSGATLQADKTLEICDNGDGTWTFSGAVSIWNTGAKDATGCQIYDFIESKISGPVWTTNYVVLDNVACGNLSVIPGNTSEEFAFVTTYSYSGPALDGSIRNNALVTIDNHSGGRTNGPNPKASYSGPIPPVSCETPCGCSYTQGYWKTHYPDAWPSNADSILSVFGGAYNAEQILLTEPQFGNAWIILAHQYIAYLLNSANGACTPSGLQGLVGSTADFFAANSDPALCTKANGWCGASVADACILDEYNHGSYPQGPQHCGGDDPFVCSSTTP